MRSSKSSKEVDSSVTDHQLQQDEQNDSKKREIPKKIYVHRNSVLNDHSKQLKHFESLSNIFLTVTFFILVCLLLFYVAEPSKLWEDLDVLTFSFFKASTFLECELLFHALAYGFYEGFKLWIAVRIRFNTKVADKTFLLLYIASFFSTLLLGAVPLFKKGVGPVIVFAITIEQVRIYMKIHSFVRENTPRVLKYKLEKDGNQQHALYPTRKHFLYYLFCPVFIYRDSYPRTEKRHWKTVFYHLSKFLLSIFVGYCVYMRLYREMFKNVGLQPFTKKETVFILAGSLAAAPAVQFLLFYGFFHSYLNFCAELLRFGDREFYRDWWNITNNLQFYRKWNVVVYDWLYTYIYTDMQKLGFGRTASMFLVLMASGISHEYIVGLSLGYIYPMMSFFLLLSGIVRVFVGSKGTKVSTWLIHIFGWSVMISMQIVEWYARNNCPKEETFLNFFKPRSLDPSSCRIFEFS